MQKNEFSIKDSSLAFILAIVLPNILALIIFMIVGNFIDLKILETTTFYKIFTTILSPISFILVFLFISLKSKVNIKAVKTEKMNFVSVLTIIVISFACLFLISPIINVYDSFLTSIGVKEQTLPISLDSPLKLIYLIFSLGILAPISEEFVFRGIIFSGLKEKGLKNAVLISSLLFMLMHLSLHQTIYQFLLGIVLAMIYYYTQNIFASILVHFINNTFVLLINYFSPSFFDYRFLTVNYIILALVLFVVGVIIIYNLLRVLKHKNENKYKNSGFTNKVIETNNQAKNQTTNQARTKSLYLPISLIFGVLMWIISVVSLI